MHHTIDSQNKFSLLWKGSQNTLILSDIICIVTFYCEEVQNYLSHSGYLGYNSYEIL